MTERNKVYNELKDKLPWECEEFLEEIATFIIADRARIIPHIKAIQGLTDNKKILELCREIIKLSGVTQ